MVFCINKVHHVNMRLIIMVSLEASKGLKNNSGKSNYLREYCPQKCKIQKSTLTHATINI